MSHESGKIEMVGMSDGQVFFKYNRSVDIQNNASFLTFESNPDAYWFDDYHESEAVLKNNYSIKNLILQLTKAIR
jgi:hypothetical protein